MILSIVMPAYNASRHMEGTLRSVAPLLGAEAELVVVDDGSTDDSVEKFLQLQKAVPLVNSRLVKQAHAGVSMARNTGLSAATGDFVLFLDSDDWVSQELVSALCQAVDGRVTDVVCWGWDTISVTGEVLRRYFDVHPVVPSAMTGIEALHRRSVDRSLRLWTASAAYRRGYLQQTGIRFSPGCAVGEDLEFGYRSLLHATSVVFVPKVLAVYRKRSNSTTGSSSVERFESVLALRRVLRELESDNRAELEPIVEHFRRSKELVNYFHTLESCLRARRSGTPMGLLREVDARFPNLTSQVRTAVLARSAATPYEWRLFVWSPSFWWAWVRLRRRLDRVLPWRFRSIGPFAEKRRAALLAG